VTLGYLQTTDINAITTELASAVKDSVLVALDEHHRATAKPSIPQQSDAKASKQESRNRKRQGGGKGTGKQVDNDADDEGEDANNGDHSSGSDAEGEEFEVDFKRPCKPYSTASRRKRGIFSKKEKVCHVSKMHPTGICPITSLHRTYFGNILRGKG